MKLFPRYVPSVEEEQRERESRARHIGTDLLLIAIMLAISYISTLCGDYKQDVYIHYPQLRPLNVIFACVGLVWVAAVALFRFFMKPGTRKKLICMYILDALFGILYALRTVLSDSIAYRQSLLSALLDNAYYFPILLVLPVYHMIYYRQSKVLLVD